MTTVQYGAPDIIEVTAIEPGPQTITAFPGPAVTVESPIGTAIVVAVESIMNVTVETTPPDVIVPVSVQTTPNPITVSANVALGAGFSITGLAETFESVSRNLKAYNTTFVYTGEDVTTKTFDLGGGQSIVQTYTYTGEDLTTLVLTGDTPGGIKLTKTFSYTGDDLTSYAYS